MNCLICNKEFNNNSKYNVCSITCYNKLTTASKNKVKNKCPKCGMLISDRNMQSHMKGKLCFNNVTCLQCHKPITPTISKTNKLYYKKFCNRSCATTFNNQHKTNGTQRSKLEIYIEQQLKSLYPNLEILFNNKQVINSELDIYIPSLKLAFELNGIFHYEPIFGQEKLNKTQKNDTNKFLACHENKISLCIIDISQQKRFKETSSLKYLTIITNIIDQNIDIVTI